MRSGAAVVFEGVIKPMFTRNGFNIYPEEIRQAVSELPGVREVRVRAIPEPLRDFDIALDVDGTVTADAIRQWCETRLSAYKQPASVIVSGG